MSRDNESLVLREKTSFKQFDKIQVAREINYPNLVDGHENIFGAESV